MLIMVAVPVLLVKSWQGAVLLDMLLSNHYSRFGTHFQKEHPSQSKLTKNHFLELGSRRTRNQALGPLRLSV